MLGHPALIFRLIRGDAQREALLAEQHVAAVAGVDGPDGVVLGELDDIAVFLVHLRFGVQAADKIVGCLAKLVERLLPHTGHDIHVEHNIDRISQLDADLGERGADRAHAIRDDVHGTALHRAVKQLAQLVVHDVWVLPVVGRAGVLFFARTNERASFDACDIVDSRPMQQAAGQLFRVEGFHLAGGERLVAQFFKLRLASVDPNNLVRFDKRLHFLNPVEDIFVVGHAFTPLNVFGTVFKTIQEKWKTGFLWPFTALFQKIRNLPRLALYPSSRPIARRLTRFLLNIRQYLQPPQKSPPTPPLFL